MKKSIEQKLYERKFHRPNRFLYWLYHLLSRVLILRKYHPNIVIKDNINDCQGPCFLIWNHLSRIDHAYLIEATYPKRMNVLAGYNEFFRNHLAFPFRLMSILPKKNFAKDILGIKAMMSIIKEGGCVALSPEGMSSIYGTNQPIVPGTGHLLKHFGVPVYFLQMRGEYLANTKVCLDERVGRCDAELSLLFSSQDLAAHSKEEIEDRINLAFKDDDYEWGHENHVRWETGGRICEHLNDICYHCPKCGSDLTMVAKGNEIHCSHCGNGATMNDYYEFEPLAQDAVIPVSPSAWVKEERSVLIKDIRSDPNYSFGVQVQLGLLPKYRLLKHKKTTERRGEGLFSVDHEGIHFRGHRDGEPYSFDLNYFEVFTLVIVTDASYFGLYVGEEYEEFFPSTACVGKLLLLTEEMHRLHANTWKCFPWDVSMYEGLNGKQF